MRKLILKMDMSLDGFVGGPNGEQDWIFEHQDEGAALWVLEAIWQAGFHVMGRKTFEMMATHWPRSTEPFARPMNEIPKLVFTHSSKGRQAIHDAARKATTGEVPTQMSKVASPEEIKKNQETWLDPLIATDLVGEIARQKEKPGKNLIAYGGASFARELVKHDLVDEYRFVVRPVAIGKGLSIFDGLEKPLALKLVTSSSFPGGSTAQIFARKR
jgi:dihydrofolate reductase